MSLIIRVTPYRRMHYSVASRYQQCIAFVDVHATGFVGNSIGLVWKTSTRSDHSSPHRMTLYCRDVSVIYETLQYLKKIFILFFILLFHIIHIFILYIMIKKKINKICRKIAYKYEDINVCNNKHV